MIKFLDSVLEFVFGYGPPILVGIVGLVAVVAFFAVLLAPNMDRRGHFLGVVGLHGVCVWGFFVWFAQMMEFENGNLALSVYSTVALFVFIVVLLFGLALVNLLRIPSMLVFLFYLGIAVFGV